MSLEQIRERLEAATPGPWFREYGDVITAHPDPRDTEEGYDDPRHARVVRAAPHLPKKDRQSIADADFIAHARTDVAFLLDLVKRQQEAIERVTTLANRWEDRGEHDMDYSKTIQDEDISMHLLTEGASMVENARHIRNALKGEA